MRRYTFGRVAAASVLVALSVSALPARAGVVVYEEGDKKVELGARVQLQYFLDDPDGGDSTDDLFFRRLRPHIQGTVTRNWFGKVQFDLGKAAGGDEVAVKDAYLRYTGWKNLSLTMGNQKTPFSREFLTSSASQQLVERSFVGDHNYGAPDRMLGVRLDGHSESKKFAYAVSVGSENLDPDAAKLDFDTPANTDADWNEGTIVAGRIDFHPRGAMAFNQGDFGGKEFKYTVSLGVFSWANDDDNNTYTNAAGTSTSATRADLDSSTGYEISAGLRGRGLSLDAEFHQVESDTVDPAFTGGLFAAGETDLDVLALEGGYMVVGNRLELVAGWDSLDADNYQDAWTRTSLGFNYFWDEHNMKFQLTYRMNENLDGVSGADSNMVFGQLQHVF